jgi:hypothetical protein
MRNSIGADGAVLFLLRFGPSHFSKTFINKTMLENDMRSQQE